MAKAAISKRVMELSIQLDLINKKIDERKK